MLVRFNHTFLRFRRLLLLSFLLLVFSADLFALPIKTSILNPEKQVVGEALVYIDYVELLKLDGTSLGRLGFQLKGLRCFSCFWKHWLASLPHHLLWVTPTNSSQSDTLQVKSPILVKSTSTPRENLPYFNSPLTLSHSVSHPLQRNDYENPHQSTQNLPNQLWNLQR